MANQNIPIIKQTNWLAVIPQLLFMILLVYISYLLNFKDPIFTGCLIYLTLSFGSRKILIKDHNKGIALSKELKFSEAIAYYEKSVIFFEQHKWIDKYRCLTLFSASKISYHEMALNNIAFCYSQIGNGTKAKEYYNKTLTVFPNSVLAITALNMIDSIENSKNV